MCARSTFRALTVALAALLAGHAHAATPVTLIGADLEPKRVNLQGLDDESLSYFDADRQYRTLSIDRVLQLRELGATSPTARAKDSLGFIETADGQKIHGEIDLANTKQDKIAWDSPVLGLIEVNVDDIRSVALKPMQSPSSKDSRDDWIVLANGDSLSGMVVGAGPDGVEIKSKDANAAVKLPWERLRGFVLFNAAPRKQQPAHRFWLVDGSRILGRQVSLTGDQVAFKPLLKPIIAGNDEKNATGVVSIACDRVTRIDLFAIADATRASRRLIEMADMSNKLVSGGEVFGVPFPPFSDDQGLHLHAPVRIAYALPAGTRRLAATAELDLSPEPVRPPPAPVKKVANQPQPNVNPRVFMGPNVIMGRARAVPAPAKEKPKVDAEKADAKVLASSQDAGMSLGMRGDRESDAAWADFELIAYLNQREIARFRINAENRKIRINLPLDSAGSEASTLEFEVVPGVNGPVMDRLRLSDAAILVVPQ